jgi:hypothetical protein
MSRGLRKYFLLVTLLLAVVFNSAGKVPAAKETAGHAHVLDIPQLPHNELNEVRQPALSGAHLAVQKHFNAADLLQSRIGHSSRTSFEDFIIKASSLLIKDHLSQNYPSHNFW